MATVEFRGVTKHFGKAAAVSEFSLRIGHGEFVAVLGPSGCGKTTTLQMLAGFVEPSAGDILVDDRSVLGRLPHKRNLGVVFQGYALFPHLSVFDNVAFGLKMRRVAHAEIVRRVGEVLDLVRLGGFDRRYPRELSGGQQQRVALARALVIRPRMLLLDEPLSNLDANLREQMRFEIREIQQRVGITTVFVTHDQGEAMAVADRLVVMSAGRIRQVGTAREVYENPADLFVAGFIGQANLLRGRVAQIRGEEAEFALAGGGTIIARHQGRVAAGQSAVLALRPEDLRIALEAPPAANALSGTVTRINYLGSASNAAIRIDDAELVATIPRGEPVAGEGETVVAWWRSSAGVLLDAGD